MGVRNDREEARTIGGGVSLAQLQPARGPCNASFPPLVQQGSVSVRMRDVGRGMGSTKVPTNAHQQAQTNKVYQQAEGLVRMLKVRIDLSLPTYVPEDGQSLHRANEWG